MAKETLPNLTVYLQTLRYGHAQSCKHYGYQATSAGAVHVVEVVTGEQLVFVEGVSVAPWDGAFFVFVAPFG
jgi:hypothetical protein